MRKVLPCDGSCSLNRLCKVCITRKGNRERNTKWRKAHPKKARFQVRKYLRRARALNPKLFSERVARWRKENPEKYAETCLRFRLRKKYGLTLETFYQMVETQQGRCSLCGIKPRKTLQVDFCFKTRYARTLLCDECNRNKRRLRNETQR